MAWNIALAKQQFSELVRLSAEEPQTIYNRDRPVAMLVNASEFEQFQRWRTKQRLSSLLDHFQQGRQAFESDADNQGSFEVTSRSILGRVNSFDEMLKDEELLYRKGSK
jgi:prevent-host-death family protein